MMHGSFVRYVVAAADMANKTEEDAIEGVLSNGSSLDELFKSKPDEQLVMLSSASPGSCQGARR